MAIRGPALPFIKKQGGSFKSKGVMDLIWSSILMIVLTRKNTRIMFAEFGSSLHEVLFDRVPNERIAEIENLVREDLQRFEPRVVVENVVAKTDQQNVLRVNVRFHLRGELDSSDRTFVIDPNKSIQLLDEGIGTSL